MVELATTYHAQGRYAEDDKISTEVLELPRGVLGVEHPDSLKAMYGLAITWNS